MFFALSKQQIDSSRERTFPTSELINFRSVVFDNDLNNNTNIKLTVSVQDALINSRIFNNLEAKKYIKLRIFEISSDDIKNKIFNTKNIQELNSLLDSNGLFYRDINAATSFMGSLTDTKDHYIENENIILNYNLDFTLQKNTINNFSLGAVYYIDSGLYLSDKVISTKFINYDILYGFVKITDYFKNGINVNPNSCQDKRILKISTKALSELNIDLKTTNELNKQIKSKINKNFISDIYISKNKKENDKDYISFLFNIDYKNLVYENVNYKKFIEKSDYKNEILEQYIINSIEIYRRQVRNNDIEIKQYFSKDKTKLKKKSFLPLQETTQKLIFSSEQIQDNKSYVKESSNNDGIIREITFNSGLNAHDIRTFEVVDKGAFNSYQGFYQYGVKLNISDGFTYYLKNSLETLLKHNKILKKFLSETDNIARSKNSLRNINPHTLLDTNLVDGNYDPIQSRFTYSFIKNIFAKQYSYDLSLAVSFFIKMLKVLSLTDQPEDQLTNVLFSMLNPTYANQQSISYFIKVHDKFINQINKLIKNNYNSSINYEEWFDNDYANISDDNVGYEIFVNDKSDSFGYVSTKQIEEKIAQQIGIYTKTNSLSGFQDAQKYTFYAPNNVKIKNHILDFTSLLDGSGAITYEEFINTELEIKRYKKLSFNDINVSTAFNSYLTTELDRENLKNKFLLDAYSTTIENWNNFFGDENYVIQNPGGKTNPIGLYLSLLRDMTNTSFNNSKIVDENKDLSVLLKMLSTNNKFFPYHIYTLLSNNSKLFDNFNFEELKNLFLNSKFIFLYNTIHVLEYLKYDKEIKKSVWVPFSKPVFDSRDKNLPFLCRMNVYQNSNTAINNYQQVSLPVYNKYFLLSDDVNTSFHSRNPTQNSPSLEFKTTLVSVPPPSFTIAAPEVPGDSYSFRTPTEAGFINPESISLEQYIARYKDKYLSQDIDLSPVETRDIDENINLILKYENFEQSLYDDLFIGTKNYLKTNYNIETGEDGLPFIKNKWLAQMIIGFSILKAKSTPRGETTKIKLNLGDEAYNNFIRRKMLPEYMFDVKYYEFIAIRLQNEEKYLSTLKYRYNFNGVSAKDRGLIYYINTLNNRMTSLYDFYRYSDGAYSRYEHPSDIWLEKLIYDYCFNHAIPILANSLEFGKFSADVTQVANTLYPYLFNRYDKYIKSNIKFGNDNIVINGKEYRDKDLFEQLNNKFKIIAYSYDLKDLNGNYVQYGGTAESGTDLYATKIIPKDATNIKITDSNLINIGFANFNSPDPLSLNPLQQLEFVVSMDPLGTYNRPNGFLTFIQYANKIIRQDERFKIFP